MPVTAPIFAPVNEASVAKFLNAVLSLANVLLMKSSVGSVVAAVVKVVSAELTASEVDAAGSSVSIVFMNCSTARSK